MPAIADKVRSYRDARSSPANPYRHPLLPQHPAAVSSWLLAAPPHSLPFVSPLLLRIA